MGLKADALTVADRASRIVMIIQKAQDVLAGNVTLDDNPDLTVTISAAQRQAWLDKVQQLQAEIKAIAGAW